MTMFAIRLERPEDAPAIHALTEAAFAPTPYGDGTEAGIIDALRASGALTLSLVAVETPDATPPEAPPATTGAIIGHVAFSPVAIEGATGDWFGLGPISVRADRQRQGVGRALIADGLARLRALGAAGCALIGDPAYYSRVGFASDGRLRHKTVPTTHVQRIVFTGPAPEGELRFDAAFEP